MQESEGERSGGKGGRKENGGKENGQLSVVGSVAMERQAGRGRDESGLVRFLVGVDGAW